MPRASFYDHEEIEKTAQLEFIEDLILVLGQPEPMDKFASLFCDEDECLDFVAYIEDEADAEFPLDDIDSVIDGTVHDFVLKVAAITSAKDRAKAKMYYQNNKAAVKRKARRRRRRQQMGVQRKRKRMGSAATGYSFIMDASGGPKIQTSNHTSSTSLSGGSMPSFNPNKRIGSTSVQTSLKPY